MSTVLLLIVSWALQGKIEFYKISLERGDNYLNEKKIPGRK